MALFAKKANYNIKACMNIKLSLQAFIVYQYEK